MKILYLTYDSSIQGGIERVLQIKTDYFIEKFGYDITILSQERKNIERFYKFNNKVKFYDFKINFNNNNILKKQILRIKYFFKLRQILKQEKYDFIISTGQFLLDPLLPLFKRYSYTIREYHLCKIENQRLKGLKKFKNFIFNFFNYNISFPQLNRFIVLTKEDKENWKLKNIEVIYNPLTFCPKVFSKCENKKIISVGRLEEQKGFDILVDIWNIISKKYPDWILEIYGDGSEKEKLQNKINKLGLEKSFLLRGAVKNIQEKYLESSIYVMSSRYEGFGMVLIEAMSCGLPVISFDCPCGPKDIIKNNEDGFIVKFGDIQQMADKIEELILNKEKRKLFGKNARENVQRFSEDKIMQEWKNLFDFYGKKNEKIIFK